MMLLIKRLALAFMIPLVLLVLVEGLLRLFGWGAPAQLYNMGEWGGRILATENAHFTRKYFGSGLERSPWPAAFPVPKPANEFRVFLLGESAALGDPIPEFGLARILEVLLQEAKPYQRVRVINSAITAINSHVIREIAAEVASLEPDAVVMYMGNNEVVGPFGPGTVFTAVAGNHRLIRALTFLRGTRLSQWLDFLAERWIATPKKWVGMEMFLDRQVNADDPRLATTRRMFEENLEAICDIFQQRNTPVVLSTVAVNLRDCAPLGAPGLDHPANQRFIAARAAEMDGRLVEAATLFREAMELDTLRFRADGEINSIIHRVAGHRVGPLLQLIDSEAMIASASPNGIPGESMFYDHVHLTFGGQYLVARQCASALTGMTNVPSEAAVAERIAWSAFSERETLHEMFARRLRPPFTQQMDRDDVEQRWVARLIDAELAMRMTETQAEWNVMEKAVAARGDRDAEVWQIKAAYELSHDDPESAAAAYSRAFKLWPHQNNLLLDQASALAAAGKTEEAFRLLRDDRRWRGVADDAIWSALGGRLMALGRDALAQSLFHQAWLLNADNPEVLVNLGASRAAAGQKNEAVTMLRRAVKLKPMDDVAWANLGRALYESGSIAEGIAAMERATALNPENAATLCSLGVMYSREKKFREAQRHLEAALVESPLDVAILADATMAAVADQRYDDAAELQTRIARLLPADATAQQRAGQCWLKVDDLPQAVEHLKRALVLAPTRVHWRRNLVWLLATHPDEAVRDPEYALTLSKTLATDGDDAWMNVDVKAAALASVGRTGEASALMDRIDLRQVPDQFRAKLAARVELYRKGRPYLGTRDEYVPQ